MIRNRQRAGYVAASRLEVRWTRSYWRPRIAVDPGLGAEAEATDAVETVTIYRRSGRGDGSPGPEVPLPVVDCVGVRYENPPARITFESL
jgi:hypothetical protein